MWNRFCGWYHKLQKGDDTLSLIPGRSGQEAFIQVITQDASYNIPYSLEAYRQHETVIIGDSQFSPSGIRLNINQRNLELSGDVAYIRPTPLDYDIMGPFKYLPMQCRHSVVSMHHALAGRVRFNDRTIDFSDGIGYIESDRGRAFPKSYTWVQCNDFAEKCSVMVSIAHIPFCGSSFEGCICAILYRGRQYRLATYKGVRILQNDRGRILIVQGRMALEVEIENSRSLPLRAPGAGGVMRRTIHESASTPARFRFYDDGKLIFDLCSPHASYEFVEP
ncbi:MAG: tocopherol cyclase family protein [Christensenellales bacterium]|jgi:tocopherol cyclase